MKGTKTALEVFGPQVGGLVRIPFAPPLNLSLKAENGSCGFSASVVVSWPVRGSAATLPISLTEMP